MTTPETSLDDFSEDGSDELLVAYLDGQLDADECERLESRLAKDAPTRQRLQSLDRVWNALDVLPRSTASPAFTRSTVEMAAVTSVKPSQGGKEPGRKPWRLPPWLLASTAGVIAGAALVWTLVAAPERRALRDLPVALHASALEQIGSLDFLESFAAQGASLIEAFRSEEISQDAAEWSQLTTGAPPERRDWIDQLSPGDQVNVSERLAVYQAKSDVKQKRLVTLSEEVHAAEEADALREAALVYQVMVERLSASEQLSLRQMSSEERLRAIEREARNWIRRRTLELTAEEKAQLRKAIEKASENGAFAKLLQSRLPGLPPEVRDRVRTRPQLAPLMVTGLVASGDRRRPPSFEREGRGDRGDRGDRAERFRESLIAAWRDWFDQLQRDLPTRIQVLLAEASSDEERARMLVVLLREAAKSDLSSVFAELPNEEIEELLLLSKEEFATALSDRMMGDFVEPPRRPDDRDFGRPPGGPPPGFERRSPDNRGGDSSRFEEGRQGPPRSRGERPPREGRPPFDRE